MKTFSLRFSERRVAQWAIPYLAVSWVGLQVLQLVWEVFEWPLTPLRVVIGVLAAGFPITVVLAWVRQPADVSKADPAQASPTPGHTAGMLTSVAVVLVLLTGVGWTVRRSLDRQWAGGEAVLEIGQLSDVGDFAAAIEIGERALGILPELPVLDSLLDAVSQAPIVETDPVGAVVSVRAYADMEAPWVELGVTPLSGVRIPRGLKRWRLEKAGFETLEVMGDGGVVLNVTLPPEGSTPEGMVGVPGGVAGGFITAIGALVPLAYGDYYMDRYEVSNEQFKEFVDAGGYEREEFWLHAFMEGGRRLNWSEAIERFVDATGRAGAATWELGRPKPGDEALPVTGVSWYEAAAYAEFRGQSLPTLRHWVQAAGTGRGGLIIPSVTSGEVGRQRPERSGG